MAVRKKEVAQENKIERTFRNKYEAQAYARNQVRTYRDLGFGARYDVRFQPDGNWKVSVFYYPE